MADFPSATAGFRSMRRLVLFEWQKLWESSRKGMSLFRLVPNVVDWLETGCSDFLPPRVARLLSGYF